ncbi:hypothetical protein SAMN05216559_1907 [Halomicrobium zhouii]|uniref:Cohesin domain-containing protein n=1 Tax=Halomicrobium zhouii TaxID=767519 RepID=A0A1I6L2R0_9EURY|nr:hypothetical protein [Halomicrobium zhouii]SFR97749.1 hypothetical protein SAMN05216559_1907 [Halomicrobium zhouii]
MLDALPGGGSVVGLCFVVLVLSGSVAASGTTDVMLSPESEAVEPGATVSYDVVVEDASGGVGSFDATVATNDSDVATVQNVSYPSDPAYSQHPSGGGDAQLAASGMETLDDGPVRIATVTVATAEAGVVRLSLSVSALGDENGSAYTVGETQGRTLVVGDQATATPTETDEDSSAGSGGSSGGDSSDDDSSDGDSSDGDTADDDSSDDDDSTESETESDAGTETDSPDETATSSPTSTATNTSTAGGAVTPEPDTPSSTPTTLLLAGAVLVVAVAGLVYYWL